MSHTPGTKPGALKIDYAAMDRQRGEELLTAFISWVNADDEDSIVISRGSACYMRDEIERLREMAAAPELLETLKTLRSFVWKEGYADTVPAMAKADVVISKATGGAE